MRIGEPLICTTTQLSAVVLQLQGNSPESPSRSESVWMELSSIDLYLVCRGTPPICFTSSK
jgi:hypothetical protein